MTTVASLVHVARSAVRGFQLVCPSCRGRDIAYQMLVLLFPPHRTEEP